jgi:thiol-disulfide isomerase/thioredoxin
MSRLTLLAVAMLAAPALAEPVSELTVGDEAPAFNIAHWVKGEPVNAFEPGSIYVVEFWATWCGPCKAAMPHVTALQEQYKPYGVTFIGISDEKLEIVSDFLAKGEWNQKMGYTVATDPDRSTYLDYMYTSGNRGIPTAFLIGKEGVLEWIGHPMEIDQPLEAVVKGTWDRDAFRKDWEIRMAAKRQAMQPAVRIERAKQAGDWQTVLAMIDERIASNPDMADPKFQKFAVLLTDVKDAKAGYSFGQDMVKAHWDDAQFLNRVAWFTVQEPDVVSRDLGFCLDVAQRASELKQNQDPAILDTLARVQFERGEVPLAIQTQTAAIEAAKTNAKTAGMVDGLTETLNSYTNAIKK